MPVEKESGIWIPVSKEMVGKAKALDKLMGGRRWRAELGEELERSLERRLNAVVGRKNKELTGDDVVKIRQEYARGSTQRELSKKWGVAVSTIGKIVNRQTWKNV